MIVYRRRGLAFNSSSTQAIVFAKNQADLQTAVDFTKQMDAVVTGDQLKAWLVRALLTRQTQGRVPYSDTTLEQVWADTWQYIFKTTPPFTLSEANKQSGGIYFRELELFSPTSYEHQGYPLDFLVALIRWISKQHALGFADENTTYDITALNGATYIAAYDFVIESEHGKSGHDWSRPIYVIPLRPQVKKIHDRIAAGGATLKKVLSGLESDYIGGIKTHQWVLRQRGNLYVVDFSKTAFPSSPVMTPPYLLDLSITSKCNAGCAFCYLDCTSDGGHGQYDPDLFRCHMRNLQTLGIQEIVLSGGEATIHPNFMDIVKALNAAGFLGLTLTTRDYEVYSKFPELVYLLDGVAFSVSNVQDIRKLAAALIRCRRKLRSDTYSELRKKMRPLTPDADSAPVAIQVIPEYWGSSCVEVMDKLLTIVEQYVPINATFVLLGHKATGRGSSIECPELAEADVRLLLKLLETSSYNRVTVSIDSTFSDRYRKYMDGVDELDLNIQEGAQSCFGVLGADGGIRLWSSSTEYAKKELTGVNDSGTTSGNGDTVH